MDNIKIHILASSSQYATRPDSIKMIQDFGYVSIRYEEGNAVKYADGTHIAIEGNKHEILSWLGDSFWLGRGIPMLQQFELFQKDTV